jgi:hypothetical protein
LERELKVDGKLEVVFEKPPFEVVSHTQTH